MTSQSVQCGCGDTQHKGCSIGLTIVHLLPVFSLFTVCSVYLTWCVYSRIFTSCMHLRPHVTIPIYTPLLVSLFTDEDSWRLPKHLIYFVIDLASVLQTTMSLPSHSGGGLYCRDTIPMRGALLCHFRQDTVIPVRICSCTLLSLIFS